MPEKERSSPPSKEHPSSASALVDLFAPPSGTAAGLVHPKEITTKKTTQIDSPATLQEEEDEMDNQHFGDDHDDDERRLSSYFRKSDETNELRKTGVFSNLSKKKQHRGQPNANPPLQPTVVAAVGNKTPKHFNRCSIDININVQDEKSPLLPSISGTSDPLRGGGRGGQGEGSLSLLPSSNRGGAGGGGATTLQSLFAASPSSATRAGDFGEGSNLIATNQASALLSLFSPNGGKQGGEISQLQAKTIQQQLQQDESQMPSAYEVPISGGGDISGLGSGTKASKTKRCCWNGSCIRCDCTTILGSIRRRIGNPKQVLSSVMNETMKSSTWIGAFVFSLYHVVFCLTMGSAITRPYTGLSPDSASLLGVFTQMTSIGIILSSPIFWISLGDDIPALYPTIDLFTAPFIAKIAAAVDQTLHEESKSNGSNSTNDATFLATFTFLASLSVFVSGTMLALASVFKLANLGSYLPSAVISGFFACVGVLLWTLAVKIDAHGKTIDQVIFSTDMTLISNTLLHHGVSFVIGVAMKIVGPRGPLYVVLCVFATIALFYASMLVSGKSMDEMAENGWFWSRNDLLYDRSKHLNGSPAWGPPAPLGWINFMVVGDIHWGAVMNGMSTTLAFSLLYTIRCTLHAPALRKCVTMLERPALLHAINSNSGGIASDITRLSLTRQSTVPKNNFGSNRVKQMSETVDIDLEKLLNSSADDVKTSASTSWSRTMAREVERAEPTHHTLQDMLLQYGFSQYICGLAGSFAVTPSIAASPTLYQLRAENIAPQVGAVLLLILIHLTDYQLVSYIPKPAFSSMLVLAFLDIMETWCYRTYLKMDEKVEWLVVPLILICSFVTGLLSAVFLGIALSTVIFVSSFFKSGVVKYIANGITIRSTIERSPDTAHTLDMTGDQIQVLVLQNYLFFGNASSIFGYVISMFEEPRGKNIDLALLPPFPKIVILDFALVSGMDSSTVDVLKDILSTCNSRDCKLFLSGVSNQLRRTMTLGGFKPDTRKDRKHRPLRIFGNLDTAIGKAEDVLLGDSAFDGTTESPVQITSRNTDSGFQRALSLIDQQHEVNYADHLKDLEEFSEVIELESGRLLYGEGDEDRGLFFIEEGVMKIERSSNFTLTRTASNETFRSNIAVRNVAHNAGSLNQLRARSTTLGRSNLKMKLGKTDPNMQMFRVARIGPGWVFGTIEALSGMARTGSVIAVTDCRLHKISFEKLQGIEETHPLLVLRLYKLLSLLMAKRQEVTIEHLATLHSIMEAPARTKPVSRAEYHLQI